MKRDLNSRLSSLHQTGEIKTGRQVAEDHEKSSINDLFPGQGREDETDFGRCYMREQELPLAHRHGSSSLDGILSCWGPELALPARNSGLVDFNPYHSLFLDIETTGLSGGTGTWAFLIGLGWFEDNQFRLRQYFLRRPSEERAILKHINNVAANFPIMVTFNGKLFDLPLLQTRQMLSGLKRIEPAQHLDLLQCARALWKKRLPSRSLQSLEETLLDLKRGDDIPGSEIPAVYFDYLRRGKTDLIKKVFQHNALDILSMVTLLERIFNTSSGKLIEHPAEAISLGCLCLKAGRSSEGIGYLREALKSRTDPWAEEAALELSLHYKRQGKLEEAVSIWQESVTNNLANPKTYIELAKYYEHRCKEFRMALELTEKALAVVKINQAAYFNRTNELSPEALQHRLKRLKRRLLL